MQTDDLAELPQINKENEHIQFDNRICANRKPYFFGYVYPKKMKEFKKYKALYEQLSYQKFHIKFKELLKKDNLTSAQKQVVKQYYQYMPLLNNNCMMNILAKYVEDTEFDNRWKSPADYFDYTIFLSNQYEVDTTDRLFKSIVKLIKEFNHIQELDAGAKQYEEREDITFEESEKTIHYFFEYYEDKLFALCSNKDKLTDYAVVASYTVFKHQSKSLLWNVLGEYILEHIKNKSTKVCYPIEVDEGTEYLGKYYALYEREINNEL